MSQHLRDFHAPGRSPVIAERGMIATSHPLSSAVGLDVLRAGGNAVDAAISALAVQGVVEPQSTGIGGDCFALLSLGGGERVIGLNGSGRAPAGLDLDTARASQDTDAKIARHSPHAVTLPGAVDAWITLLDAHGTWGIDRVLGPAIDYAERGFAVHPRVHFDWLSQLDLLNRSPAGRAMLTDDGQAPRVGQRWAFPELAASLREIARHGRAGFYDGWVLDDILGTLRGLGGTHTAQDFAATRADWVTPISASYRGVTLHEIPPNGQGLVALMMLKILERLPTGDGPISPARLHAQAEAAHLCYADRNSFIAEGMDPVDLNAMLSDARAARGASMIDPARTLAPLAAPRPIRGGDTVTLSVVDRDRNAISLINSVYSSFGSGIVAPRAGVWLHNRAQSFSLDPSHPNAVAPGKRPMHTIIPTIATRNGRTQAAFGVMGADYQPQGQIQVLTAMLDHGLDIQAAIDLPRVYANAALGLLEVDPTLPSDVMTALARMGHRMMVTQTPHGGAQGVWIDHAQGFLWGGSDPRKDGCAIGY